MIINEMENLFKIRYEGKAKEGQVGEGWHFWTSALSGSTFLTESLDPLDIIGSRNETDHKFPISQLRASIEENLMGYDESGLNALRTRLAVMIRTKGCLCRSHMFCQYDGKCDDCEHVAYGIV